MFSLSAEYADKMYENGIPVVVLKGLAFGVYFPNPMSRECGDLDCYMMGKDREGDHITALIGGKVEDGGYKHAHLHYKGLTIENHYYLTNFNNTKRLLCIFVTNISISNLIDWNKDYGISFH